MKLGDGYQIIDYVKNGNSMPAIAKAMNRSESGIRNFLIELRKAAKAKMTLETYFEKNRPFRFGKKEIK